MNKKAFTEASCDEYKAQLFKLKELFEDKETVTVSSNFYFKFFTWSIMSTIAKNKYIHISYPILFISPSFMEYLNVLGGSCGLRGQILGININLTLIFLSSLIAVIHHILFNMKCPIPIKQFKGFNELLAYVTENHFIDSSENKQIVECYWNHTIFLYPKYRLLLGILASLCAAMLTTTVIINMVFIISEIMP